MNTVRNPGPATTVIVAVLLAATLGACTPRESAATSTPGHASTSATPDPHPTPSGTPSRQPPAKLPLPQKPPNRGAVTVSGIVEPGVEAGCLMLRSGGARYDLVGGDRGVLRSGVRVQVVGVVTPSVVTICMQGMPLVVQQVRAG